MSCPGSPRQTRAGWARCVVRTGWPVPYDWDVNGFSGSGVTALAAFGVMSGLYLLVRGLDGYRSLIRVSAYLTSSITSIAAGEVRITGAIEAAELTLVSFSRGVPCVYYRSTVGEGGRGAWHRFGIHGGAVDRLSRARCDRHPPGLPATRAVRCAASVRRRDGSRWRRAGEPGDPERGLHAATETDRSRGRAGAPDRQDPRRGQPNHALDGHRRRAYRGVAPHTRRPRDHHRPCTPVLCIGRPAVAAIGNCIRCRRRPRGRRRSRRGARRRFACEGSGHAWGMRPSPASGSADPSLPR